MSVPSDSLNSRYLDHIDQTLKSVIDLNEMEKKSGFKEGHYYANILVSRDGSVALEAKKGGMHTSFAELTRFMEKIAKEPDSEQKTNILRSYKRIVTNYRGKERGIFEKFTALFNNKRNDLLAKANTLLSVASGEESISQPAESVEIQKNKRTANIVLTTMKTMNELNEVNEKAGIPLRYRVGIKQIAPGEARIFLAGSHDRHANFENATTLLEDMARNKDVSAAELRDILDIFKKIKGNFYDAVERLKSEKGLGSKIANFFTLRSMNKQLERANAVIDIASKAIADKELLDSQFARIGAIARKPEVSRALGQLIKGEPVSLAGRVTTAEQPSVPEISRSHEVDEVKSYEDQLVWGHAAIPSFSDEEEIAKAEVATPSLSEDNRAKIEMAIASKREALGEIKAQIYKNEERRDPLMMKLHGLADGDEKKAVKKEFDEYQKILEGAEAVPGTAMKKGSPAVKGLYAQQQTLRAEIKTLLRKVGRPEEDPDEPPVYVKM